jgi:hypothetical protein
MITRFLFGLIVLVVSAIASAQTLGEALILSGDA